MKNLLSILPAIVCLTMFCSQPVGNANRPHENTLITGKLLSAENKPAVGAIVRFIPINSSPMPGLKKTSVTEDTCITDENGTYGFDSLPDTLYNVFGEDGNNVSFRYSVKIVKKNSTHIPNDTLKAPGSIYGIIRLLPEHSSRTVILLFPGTHTYVIPSDSIGHFTVPRMARGKYTVRIISTLPDYIPKDTFFTIRSGRGDTLKDTLRLGYTGIPTVTGVKATLDSVRILVSVSWNGIDTSFASGYNIYRGNTDSTFRNTPINKTLVKNTFYVDENLVQRQGQRMMYKVKAVNRNGDEGKTFSIGAEVIISSAFYEKERIDLADHPRSITANKNGDIFVQYANTPGMFRFRRNSSNAEQINLSDSTGRQYTLIYPSIDLNGNFYGVWIGPTSIEESIVKFDSNGIFQKTIQPLPYEPMDFMVAGNDTMFVLNYNANGYVELQVFNTNGDSLANWRVQYCSEADGYLNMLNSMAISGSFITMASMFKIETINRFTGTMYREYPAQQWNDLGSISNGSNDKIVLDRNSFYYVNALQGRFYQISFDGEVMNTIETDPLTAQFIKTDSPPMAICSNSELIITSYWGNAILRYGRKP